MFNGLGLFAGIGGIELGLEQAGLCKPVCFVENNKYSQEVLAKRFPEVPIWDDVKTFDGRPWKGKIDIISGGFPCQDFSKSGRGQGFNGNKSTLWSDYKRAIIDIQPLFAIVENVDQLIYGECGAWFGRLLSDLEQIGYSAEWMLLRSSDLGACHRRERVWIVAYPKFPGWEGFLCRNKRCGITKGFQTKSLDTQSNPFLQFEKSVGEPAVSRMDDEVSNRVDRLECLGNSVDVKCAEYIGEIILNRIINH